MAAKRVETRYVITEIRPVPIGEAIARRREVFEPAQPTGANPLYHPIAVALRRGAPAGERAEAIATIKAALEKTDGVIGDAAIELSCDRRTLTRWLARPELAAVKTFASKLRERASKPGRK